MGSGELFASPPRVLSMAAARETIATRRSSGLTGSAKALRGARIAAPIAVGVVVVGVTAIVVGVGPFLRGIAAVSPVAILSAVALTAVASAAAAWRWRTVAASLGLPLSGATAFAAYYRSQFLNTVLPGGILGDAHRAYDHGRRQGTIGTAARAVAVERIAGQVVQTVLTLVVLILLGFLWPGSPTVWTAGAAIALAAVAIGVIAAVPRGRRALRREIGTLRPLLSSPCALLTVVGTSIVVVAAHAATFMVAAFAVGIRTAPHEMAAVALIVLGASAIPLNVGGWGPREAASGSAFALMGLGPGAGVAVSTAFGVLVMVAVAPGVVVLLAGGIRAAWRMIRPSRGACH